jgi:5-methylcytosine-specific restriction endonuclease McrA
MQLDHVNGVKNDNRLANLRMLCPNCHSQTPTFTGRNLKRIRGLQGAAEVV